MTFRRFAPEIFGALTLVLFSLAFWAMGHAPFEFGRWALAMWGLTGLAALSACATGQAAMVRLRR